MDLDLDGMTIQELVQLYRSTTFTIWARWVGFRIKKIQGEISVIQLAKTMESYRQLPEDKMIDAIYKEMCP